MLHVFSVYASPCLSRPTATRYCCLIFLYEFLWCAVRMNAFEAIRKHHYRGMTNKYRNTAVVRYSVFRYQYNTDIEPFFRFRYTIPTPSYLRYFRYGLVSVSIDGYNSTQHPPAPHKPPTAKITKSAKMAISSISPTTARPSNKHQPYINLTPALCQAPSSKTRRSEAQVGLR